MYVSYGSTGNRVAVVDAATCNAADTSGCGQTPAVVRAGQGTFVLAVSAATDTVYGPHVSSDTVAVINGATCNGTDHSGCGHLAATAKAGSGPFGVAVNDRTHTVYVTNNAGGDSPGTVSVINSATCNGTMTAGCTGPFPTMATGRSPLLAAVDARTGTVYVTDNASAAVTILNGSRCNASVTSGCGKGGREQPVGSQPLGLAINPCTRTVYVSQIFQPGSLSIFSAARRRGSPRPARSGKRPRRCTGHRLGVIENIAAGGRPRGPGSPGTTCRRGDRVYLVLFELERGRCEVVFEVRG